MPYDYYNIDLRITIGRVQFGVAHSIFIENTTEKFSDTAKIELPREFKNAKQEGRDISLANESILKHIKQGDAITIEAGYNGVLKTEFEGYVTTIGADIPLLIECEDEMYMLKKMPLINKTFQAVKLKELLQFIAPNYEIDSLDMPLGKLMIERATPYKVIEMLKEKFGIRCYFKEKVLKAGLAVDFEPNQTHRFEFGKNIRKSSDLKFVTRDQKKLWIKAESIQKGSGQKITYEFGDHGESEITLHAPLNLNLSELKEWAEKYYKSKVYDGYEGSVDGWAYPRTKAGDSAELIDPNYPDEHRNGNFFIESVETTIDGDDGFKRSNKLSFKIK